MTPRSERSASASHRTQRRNLIGDRVAERVEAKVSQNTRPWWDVQPSTNAGSEPVALRAGQASSVDRDPGVGAPVGLRVSGIPLLAMPGMTCLCLLSHEREAAIEKFEQRIDNPTPFLDTELVLVEEHLAATEEVQASAMLIDVDGIAEGDPVPRRDRDIPEPIDWASPIPVDE